MSEWQKGDLALCIHFGAWFLYGNSEPVDTPVKAGKVFTVVGVVPLGDTIYLTLAGVQRHHYAPWFRKITPEKPDEFDREVIEAMKERVDNG